MLNSICLKKHEKLDDITYDYIIVLNMYVKCCHKLIRKILKLIMKQFEMLLFLWKDDLTLIVLNGGQGEFFF